MMLIDANILLYAYFPRAKQHDACRQWLEDAFSGPSPAYLAWITILAFLRIATSNRVFEQPLSMSEAKAVVSGWISAPTVFVLEPGERYWEILSDVLIRAQVTGPLVTDAALAALALEHGMTLCTADRDFTRFPGLITVNPAEGR